MLPKMRYRLALDLGSTSLGWALIRLNTTGDPCAIIKAGVRIFPDGRNPKDGSSLAVTRRNARAMRRRRDRLLKRKARMISALVEHGFFPCEKSERKALETLNPYELRAKGLDTALEPFEFGRALFHITQRRGFKSNRKTDKKDYDSGALKTAIRRSQQALSEEGVRTVGEWLYKRMANGKTVRARYRERKIAATTDGKAKIDRSYDLYIDRSMIEAEFDALWKKQEMFDPILFNEAARADLKDALLYQRPLRPVRPGRCTLLPDEERAPLALPSTQRFRIYQEINHLRVLGQGLSDEPLTLQQRDTVADALERNSKRSFSQIKKLLDLDGSIQFNLEDPKRDELKGNSTSALLSKAEHFGQAWFDLDAEKQDEIVMRLVKEENETKLIRWLQIETGINEERAESIANVALPEGYGSLSMKALQRIIPELQRNVISYDKAVQAAGFEHHSDIARSSSGKLPLLSELPYYGQALQRHVGFGTNSPDDNDERRYGKIANPTVHIGLNQVRTVVNALIRRYGTPQEVIIEVARDLKQSKKGREEENKRQAENQKRNARLRADIANALQICEEHVKASDLQKRILWEELCPDNVADRRCPYTGEQISSQMLHSDEVEIEHILPFSITLDDSLNNKTVCLRSANRIKGNETPWDAFGKKTVQGFDYEAILQRAKQMPRAKRTRFGKDGYQLWLNEEKDFLARALNDTRYLSKIAREYLSLICENTRVIPGQMTALLRGKFGLNKVLGVRGEKNRNDHRHHAVDACVVGVTDQGLLQRFASASANARERQLDRLVESMPLPWPTYREHVQRAVNSILVSYKPDHSHEGAMHNDTAYGLLGDGRVGFHKVIDDRREYIKEKLKVIEFSSSKAMARHGVLENGQPKPYKGYKGDSNYCIEIISNEKGKWEGRVVTTFDAYQLVRTYKSASNGIARLRDPHLSVSDKPLVMRLMIGDYIRAIFKNELRILTVKKIKSNGGIFVAQHNEANVRQREDEKDRSLIYGSFTAGSLQKSKGRCITVSPIGELRDPGFKE